MSDRKKNNKIVLPNCEVVYYEYRDFGQTNKKLVKITSTLSMLTVNRGKVKSTKIEPLEIPRDYGITQDMLDSEIGKIKNIGACYEVRILN